MSRALIIAEAGVNHNGNLNIAKKLIVAAKESGADIIKFQIFRADRLTTSKTPKAQYQKKTNFKNQNQMLKKLEIKEKDFISLKKFCKKKKIEFSASFFNAEDLHLVTKLNLKRIKIPSGEITNYSLLKKIGSLNKKVIMSTGMSNLIEIKQALDLLVKSGTKKNNISILHCNSEYPTPINDVNLLAIKQIKNEFKIAVGYSDHTIELETPIAAISLGAKIIEKHLTLSRNFSGPDHKSSLIPKEFKKMVFSIRTTEKLLGARSKKVTKSEKKNILKCRQFLVAKEKIFKNEKFSHQNITTKRTGTGGISPMKISQVLGKRAKKDYKIDEKI